MRLSQRILEKEKRIKRNISQGKEYRGRTGQDRDARSRLCVSRKLLLPKICILENVPEIGSSTVFHDALRRLRGSGYFVEFKRLKAHHYGVPQRRENVCHWCP